MVCRLGATSSTGLSTGKPYTLRDFSIFYSFCVFLQRERSCPDSLLVAAEDGHWVHSFPMNNTSSLFPGYSWGLAWLAHQISSLADAVYHAGKQKHYRAALIDALNY